MGNNGSRKCGKSTKTHGEPSDVNFIENLSHLLMLKTHKKMADYLRYLGKFSEDNRRIGIY